ncbi:glycoside hydrolase family 3 N-terminal domain-containing protein [Homoserinibacter sp. YIM 151385]|uniref:glycoside hydrolase family 3 N-terminal domain-containing protein n=1 Tax=Homoserinibacter sp. YIM 151385 TaxID=2985506 RepID=UPI0022F08D13|nr:glycoside hydrolase family 3 N-terminal domain-containing protein [Homoserinibacter sp. YIM 151385]WBU38960.1 glycoside hydrolase family 3 protein [Homoserinibacter sp. YIM 151385]
MSRRSSRPVRALGAAGLAVLLLVGCTSAPAAEPDYDWDPPAKLVVDPLERWVEARLDAMTFEEQVASLVVLHVAGTEPGPLRARLEASGAGGVIVMGDNVPASGGARALGRTVEALTVDPAAPPLVLVDQEGGIVRRVPGDDGPAAPELRAAPPAASARAYAARARLVARAGIDVNLGIVADVTADPGSFIRDRVLGGDAATAAPRVAAAVEGERGTVLSTLKHFPGHGATAEDSHVGIPSSTMAADRWRATQAPPFEAGIEAGAELVMTGHLAFPRIAPEPASLSPEWHRILREELGFRGIVVTDDLTMLESSGVAAYRDAERNGVAALAAGADLLLYVGAVDVDELAARAARAVEDGELDARAIESSARRVLLARQGASELGLPRTCDALCRDALG